MIKFFKDFIKGVVQGDEIPPPRVSTQEIAAAGAKRLTGTGHTLHKVIEKPNRVIYQFVGEIQVSTGLFELLKPGLDPRTKWRFRVNGLTFLPDPVTGVVSEYVSIKPPPAVIPPPKSAIEGLIVFEPTREPSLGLAKGPNLYRSESQAVMIDLFSAAKVTYGETLISHVGEFICTFSNPIRLTRQWTSRLESIEPKGKLYMENGVLYGADFFYETYKL